MIIFWWMTVVVVSAIAAHLAILRFWRATLISALFSAFAITAFSGVCSIFLGGDFYWQQFTGHLVLAFAIAMLVGAKIHRISLRHMEHDRLMMQGEQGLRRTKRLGGLVFCFGLLCFSLLAYFVFFRPDISHTENLKFAIVSGIITVFGGFFLFAKRGATTLMEWLTSGRFWHN